MKKALITGIGGQDGSYLAEHLLSLNYQVFGTIRMGEQNCRHVKQFVNDRRVQFHYADLRDEESLEQVIRKCHPHEIYNLAGQVFVPTSWLYPSETMDVNLGGLARILKIVDKVCPKARVYQASTSEMFGNTALHIDSFGDDHYAGGYRSLDENSPMHPVSPYGVSKLAAHRLVDVYRKKGLYVVSGVLFNHESPRRGPEMVTRKITRQIAKWCCGDKSQLRLGNVETKRDWGFAGDYVKAMHSMLQLETPMDFVIGTGKAHSVSDFLYTAIKVSGVQFTNIELNCPEFSREMELYYLLGDALKAKTLFGWEPQCTFQQLVEMMVKADLDEIRSDDVTVQRQCCQ